MLIVDTGPLVAAADRADRHHAQFRDLLETDPEPFETTAMVVAEAAYLLDRQLGTEAEVALAVARHRAATSSARHRSLDVSVAEVEVGNVLALVLPGNSTRRQYRVVARTDSSLSVVEIWRSEGLWKESSRIRELSIDAASDARLITRDGPRTGDAVHEPPGVP